MHSLDTYGPIIGGVNPLAGAIASLYVFFFVSLACIALATAPAHAESTADAPASDAPTTPVEVAPDAPAGPNLWGLEVDTVQPLIPTVHIARLRGTRVLWDSAGGLRGDLLLGFTIRPGIKHDVVDYIHEYQAGLGYRQYFWRGLHAEVGVDAGVAWGNNLVDGKKYQTATLFLNTNVGYRFSFFEPGGFFERRGGSLGFYVMPQVGVYTSLGVADIGPRNGKPDVFPQANLFLGMSF